MARKSYVQINGKLYDKDALRSEDSPRSAAILGDAPEFISPIDGSVVSGRAGIRDHCARHNVVPTADLAGLPTKPMVNTNFDSRYREETKQTIAAIINSRTYR